VTCFILIRLKSLNDESPPLYISCWVMFNCLRQHLLYSATHGFILKILNLLVLYILYTIRSVQMESNTESALLTRLGLYNPKRILPNLSTKSHINISK
jgi:hypothetical protein